MRRSWLALALLLVGCGAEEPGSAVEEAPVTTPTVAARPGESPWFEEAGAESGLAFSWVSGHATRHYFPEIMGGGVAVFDLERDGDLDLYFVQAGGVLVDPADRPPNQLFVNDGTGRFRDATEGSGADDRGFGMGVALGDYNEDGLEDLYVTNVGANVLYENLGDGRFADVTARAGVGDPGWSTSSAFFDYDRDGDLDLYVVNYIHWTAAGELSCASKLAAEDYCSPKSYDAPAPDTLYRNEGDGTFTDVSAAAGLRLAFGNGLGVVCADFDGDGFEDVFIANDGVKNQLWHNLGGERFENVADAMGCAVDQDGQAKAGMGTHVVDYDDDGDEDLLVVNLTGEADTFFRNDGGVFRDRTPLVGLTAASRNHTRFGMGFVDFDADGFSDLYQANGGVTRPGADAGPRPFDQSNLLFRGSAEGRYREVLPRGGTRPELVATSRGSGFGDLDGDGAVDIVVVNRDGPLHVLRNRAPQGNWITLDVRERSGRAALGATVRARLGERALLRRVRSAYGYCTANDPRLHLGLGVERVLRDVEIAWVDGEREVIGELQAGGVVTLRRGDASR